ncbi:hypothetical protein EIK77_010213 [Talaromyces pinophilus]|nr:hypothetical protein EIK77_010213 [Talaromyces pinophilus]
MGNTTSAVAQQCLLDAVGNDASLVAFPSALLYGSVDVNPYNLDYPVTPAAVTFPESADQVAAIVKCAVDADAKVQAKSGGHSYANYAYQCSSHHFTGLGGDDGAIVVDLRHFQQFSYDPTTQYATIGAGTLLGDIDTKLHDAGNRAMTHGTSPQVGIGGHATIGGLGPTARQFGMALDHVESVQVVLANSSIVTASTTEYPDIFYAIKGAGASFGVVTEFTVRTEAEPGIAVQYQFTFNLGDTSSRANTFKAWQQFIADPSLPREFSCQLVLAEGILLIEGEFFGSLEDFEALQLESKFPANQGYNVTVFDDWLALVAAWGVQLGEDLTGGIPAHFYSKSLPFTNTSLIPDDVVDDFFEYIDTADKDTLLWFIIFDLEGGAISDVPVHATSYGHRDALFWLQSYAINLLGPVSATTKTFLNQVNNVFLTGMPDATFGAYPGYVDRELTNGPEQYWGPNLETLIEMKSAVDPQDIFHNPQSVPLQ